ncbi:MAG: N-acetyl-gamma-glutamyl-phosphate reductase [Actinomycetota bacterium]|nr:N-acetyl-gamma-glutamyl-phosphate reductase [Actinomycetota bacterium]
MLGEMETAGRLVRVGVVGGSGYTGAELLRLCHGHPGLEVAWATGDTQAGTRVADLYPSLAAAYPDLVFDPFHQSMAGDVDLVFLALPHGASQLLVPRLLDGAVKVVDLAADFRLRDPAAYAHWYGDAHAAPALLDRFTYGLPERHRKDISTADAVAAPGCYPTAATLALAPLVDAGAIETTGVIVDAASGVSGAGRAPKPGTHYGTANEDFVAYGLLDHRHTPEIEQATGASVLFTPHLAPMTRGILATCYARPARPTSTDDLLDLLRTAYAGEPFVVVGDKPPSTKATWGSNAAHLTARFDPRTGWVVVLAALDNLVKGASGQAVQCANLMLGLDEQAGLSSVGVYP